MDGLGLGSDVAHVWNLPFSRELTFTGVISHLTDVQACQALDFWQRPSSHGCFLLVQCWDQTPFYQLIQCQEQSSQEARRGGRARTPGHQRQASTSDKTPCCSLKHSRAAQPWAYTGTPSVSSVPFPVRATAEPGALLGYNCCPSLMHTPRDSDAESRRLEPDKKHDWSFRDIWGENLPCPESHSPGVT